MCGHILSSRKKILTRIGDLNSDVASLEGLAIQSQSLLEALDILEFSVGETLRAHEFPVLDDTDAAQIAALEELANCLVRSLVREVAQVSSVRRLGGNFRGVRVALADRKACSEKKSSVYSCRRYVRIETGYIPRSA